MKKIIEFEIDEIVPGLNEILKAHSRHWSFYSKMKAEWKQKVKYLTLTAPKIKNKAHVYIELTFPTKIRHDKDNYYTSFKLINDGLTETCLKDDNSDLLEPHLLDLKYEKGVRKTRVVVMEEND